MQSIMKKTTSILLITSVLSTNIQAFSFFEKKTYPKIYPFVPMKISEIYGDVERAAEDKNFIRNFRTIVKKGFSKARTKRQPWTASYWPLAKGTIADPFLNSRIPYYSDFARTHYFLWKSSKSKFDDRKEDYLSKIDELDEDDLAKLAPSEKYDLLMGDKNFTMTTMLMQNMYDYGENNFFWALDRINVSEEDTLKLADQFKKWGWKNNKSLEDSLRNDEILKYRLESKMALKLLDSGQVDDLREAFKKVHPKALKERKNYVLSSEPLQNIASWEGICNGWAIAAGIIPRPKRSIDFRLPNGKKLRFFPSDIKGLISLYWFNSSIQKNYSYDEENEKLNGGAILVGNRCNLRRQRYDDFGRLYDHSPDPRSNDHSTPRCVGVHPAKWHLGLVNIIGKQNRSFIVERKVKDPVDNHPMYKYEFTYFDPYTGSKRANPMSAIRRINTNDQFYKYRNPKAKFIVGVENITTYLNYSKPRRVDEDSPEDDDLVDKKMYYDLELDENYNVIGGQWRAIKVGKPSDRHFDRDRRLRVRKNYNQPDFFWTISKKWKKSGEFSNIDVREDWKDFSAAPPKSWFSDYGKKYLENHELQSTYNFMGKKCKAKHKITGKEETFWCQIKRPRPLPFVNVLNVLIEKSSGIKYEDF